MIALPPLTFPDLYSYYVCGVITYTAEQFHAYKLLEVHAQDLEIYNCGNIVSDQRYVNILNSLPFL